MAAIRAGFAHAFALLGVVIAFAAPTPADSADLKKQLVEQNAAPYEESFNRQDVAGVVAHYANDAVVVNQAGLQTDLAKHWEGAFKAGIKRLESTVDQAWALGSDTALGTGKWRVTGKTESGAPIDLAGLWTAVYVREGGKWKIRMSSIIPQPPPK